MSQPRPPPPAPPPPPPTYVLAPPPRRWSFFGLFGVLVGGVFLGSTCSTCLTMQANREGPFARQGPKIGVVEVLGTITDSRDAMADLAHFAHEEAIEAVVVRVDSPGGAVGASQEIYESIRRLATKKPVVASMGGVAASGGFWISLAADEIFASPGTITGSIGVIVQIPDLTKLKQLLRFDMRIYKSAPQKDLGNPLKPEREADRAIFQALVDDVFAQFVDLTAERRGLDREAVLKLADGRILTGRAAQEAGLVDTMGGLEPAARRALELARGEASVADEGLEDPILVYPPEELPPFFDLLGARLARGFSEGLLQAARDAEDAKVELR